jgi:hypothetical protein
MENVTFQQRIEEKAKARLLKDLWEASQKLQDVGSLIGHKFDMLYVRQYYDSSRTEYKIEQGQHIFNSLLPKYISQVTDEILKKVDEIDWLLQEKNQEQDF